MTGGFFANFTKSAAVGAIAAALASLTLVSAARSHDLGFGEPGKATDVTRAVEIELGDNYIKPLSFGVRAGETVRFVVRNTGKHVHEFNIGTAAMHARHQKEMAEMMKRGVFTSTQVVHRAAHGAGAAGPANGASMHDHPNSVLLDPGQTGELVWKFSEAAPLEFACNVPGHYDDGMAGRIAFGE